MRSLAAGRAALLLVVLSGCAARAAPTPMPEHLRAGLGTVAVIGPPTQPESSLAYPVPSRAGAAVAGASAGLGVGVLAGAACFGSYGLAWPACFIALWTPVMIVTGGIEGGVKGVPVADLWASAASIKEVTGEPDLTQNFAAHVAIEAHLREGGGPIRFAGNALPEAEPPRYPALAAEGIDTVVEVSLHQLRLERVARYGAGQRYGWSFSVEPLIDAPLALVVEARVRVLRATDGMVLYESAFTHRAGSQKFTEWGRDGAVEFRRERDRALSTVAEEIVSAVFGPAPPWPESPAPAPAPAPEEDAVPGPA